MDSNLRVERFIPAIFSVFFVLRALVANCIARVLANAVTRPVSSEKLQFLAGGKSAVVYAVDRERVLKYYHDSDGAKTERQAYRRLGSHPNIATFLGEWKDASIILERGQVLRSLCQYPLADSIPMQQKIRWLMDAADGVGHLHTCNIIHADVGCNNMIVTKHGCLKIIDFEGCSIDNGPADSCYECFSYRPSTPEVSQRTDIFAFGCAIYEVSTGRFPYYELGPPNENYHTIKQLYQKDCFPDVTNMPLARLMQSCWRGEFDSMGEIHLELEEAAMSYRSEAGSYVVL